MYTIHSESDVEPDDDIPVASIPVSCSGDVAVNIGIPLSVGLNSERETQEVGVQVDSSLEVVNPWEEEIDRHVWMGPTPRAYYCALQISLERLADAKVMMNVFEPNMSVNDIADRVVDKVGVVNLPQHRMCRFAVQYAAQVLRRMTGFYVRWMDARSLLVDPMPWEPLARYLSDGLLTESRRPGMVDFELPTLKDGEEPHRWLL